MPTPPFRLLNPAKFPHFINDRFNAPRNYTFAPTKLQKHEGIDILPTASAPRPLECVASQVGIVDRIGFSEQGYGHYVRIVHQWGNDTWVTWYGHFEQPPLVKVNDFVVPGQVIGQAGTTGFSTAVHIHLTLQHIGAGLKGYVVDDVVDPEPFLVNAISELPEFNEARFVDDVTIPDGKVIPAGQTFRKTWRIRNTGSTRWSSGYKLAFFGDEQMGAPASVPLPQANPGQPVDVSVDLVAPSAPGDYRSTWKPQNAQGAFFEFEMYTIIKVEATDQKDDQPQPVGFSEARFDDDITIPDGTPMKPGQAFRKTWRIRNSGKTSWGAGYVLAFFGDEQMDGPQSIPLPATAPQKTVEISVDLVAPLTQGLHRSTWKPRDPQGNFFEFEMYAEIKVLPGATVDNAQLVGGALVVKPGTTFKQSWRVTNSGDTRWGKTYTLALVNGERMGAADQPLEAVKPGQEAALLLELTAPNSAGLHSATWRLQTPDGKLFGPQLIVQIEVLDN